MSVRPSAFAGGALKRESHSELIRLMLLVVSIWVGSSWRWLGECYYQPKAWKWLKPSLIKLFSCAGTPKDLIRKT